MYSWVTGLPELDAASASSLVVHTVLVSCWSVILASQTDFEDCMLAVNKRQAFILKIFRSAGPSRDGLIMTENAWVV
jgi:hypothetical protein